MSGPRRTVVIVALAGAAVDAMRVASTASAIWVADEPANRQVGPALDRDPDLQVTWFAPLANPEDPGQLVELFVTIEDHHGPYASDVPWQEMLWLGVRDPSGLGAALAEFDGFAVASGTSALAVHRLV